jgi:hypothetical protein
MPTSGGNRVWSMDDVWKELGGMASERHCLVASASQGTRGSLYKPRLTQDDLAEWIGILGHVDILFALNQTVEEKKNSVMRIGLLAHRHKKFDESEDCLVLQQLDVGQVVLKSVRGVRI